MIGDRQDRKTISYNPQANGNNYQLLTEPAAPGAAAKRAMKAEAKRSFMLNVMRSGCVEQKLWNDT